MYLAVYSPCTGARLSRYVVLRPRVEIRCSLSQHRDTTFFTRAARYNFLRPHVEILCSSSVRRDTDAFFPPCSATLKKIVGCGNCKYDSDNDTVWLIFFWLNFLGTVTLYVVMRTVQDTLKALMYRVLSKHEIGYDLIYIHIFH